MKVKVITTMVLLLSLATNVMGQEGKYNLGRGYRAFVEIEEMGNFGIINLSTTHGYQFNPYLFLGVNLGFHANSYNGVLPMLLGLDFRVYMSKNSQFTPYVGIRGGYLYTDIMAGLRFSLNKSLGLNISVSAGMVGLLFNVGFEF